MLNQDLLNRLRSRLVEHGLSKRYVKRLVGELREHYRSSLEHHLGCGLAFDDAVKRAESSLGDLDSIADDVLSRPELLPLARRRPAMSFAAAPLLFLALAAGIFYLFECAIILGATRILDIKRTDPVLRTVFEGAHDAFVYGLPPLLAIGFCVVAYRCGCSARWALCACGLLSLAGLVRTWLVLCPGSGSIFFLSRFGLDIARLLAPWAVFSTFMLATLWRRRSIPASPA